MPPAPPFTSPPTAAARGPSIELVVRPHAGDVRHAVRQGEEGGDGARCPRCPRRVKPCARSAAKSSSPTSCERCADLHGEIEHRALARRDVGLAVVDRDLVGDQRLLRADAQDRAVRDDAVLAVVGAAGGDDDHLALGLGEAARPRPSARRGRRRTRGTRRGGGRARGTRSARTPISPARRGSCRAGRRAGSSMSGTGSG